MTITVHHVATQGARVGAVARQQSQHRHPESTPLVATQESRQPPNLDLQEAWQICRGLSRNESR